MKKISAVLILLAIVSAPVIPQEKEKADATGNDTPDVETVIERIRSRTEPLSSVKVHRKLNISAVNHRPMMRFSRNKNLLGRIEFKRDAYLKEETVTLTDVRGRMTSVVTRTLTGTSEFKKLNVTHRRVKMCLATHTKLNKQNPNGWSRLSFIQLNSFGILSDLFILNLYPRSFLTDANDINVERASTESGSVFKLIKTSSLDFGMMSQPITKVMFVDPESYRVTKFSFSQQAGGDNNTLEVDKWQTVEGVKLPKVIKFTTGRSRGYLDMRYRIQSSNQLDDGRKPSWASPFSIPEPVDAPLEKLKKKTQQKKTTPSTFIQYANSYLQKHRRSFFRPGKKLETTPLRKALERGLEQHPESDLLMEYLGMVYTTADSYEKLNSLATKHMKNSDRPLPPYIALLLSQHYNESGNDKKAKQWAETFREHDLYGIFSQQLLLPIALQDVNDPQNFLDIINTFIEGDEIQNQLNILSAIAPPLSQRRDRRGLLASKKADVLRKLNSATDQRSMKVLLARAFTRKEEYEEANKLYRKLKDLPFLNREINVYLKKAGEKSGKLIGDLIDSIYDLQLLHQHAIRSLQNKNTQQGMETAKRITDLLRQRNEKIRTNRQGQLTLSHVDIEVEAVKELIPLLEKENEERLKSYVKNMVWAHDRVLRDESIQSTVEQIFGSSPEQLYPILKYAETHRRHKLLSGDEERTILTKKINNKEADRRDYMIYAEQIVDHRVELDSIKSTDKIKQQQSHLKQAIQSHPDVLLLQERLADLYFVSGKYKKAINKYRSVGKKQDGPTETFGSVTISFEHMHAHDDNYFKKDYLIPIKIVLSYKQLGQSEKAKSYLDTRAADTRNVSKIIQLAKAYSLIDRDDAALNLLRTKFRDREKTHSWFQRNRLSQTLITALKRQEKYFEAMTVAELALEQSERNRHVEKLRREKTSLRKKIDKQKIRKEYVSRSFPKPAKTKRKQLENLVKQLGVPEFKKRERALKKLKTLGQTAIPVIKTNLDHPNPEIRNRIQNLILDLAMQQKKADIRKKYQPSEQ